MLLGRERQAGYMWARLLTWPRVFCSIMAVRLNPLNQVARGSLWQLSIFQIDRLRAGKSIRLKDL